MSVDLLTGSLESTTTTDQPPTPSDLPSSSTASTTSAAAFTIDADYNEEDDNEKEMTSLSSSPVQPLPLPPRPIVLPKTHHKFNEWTNNFTTIANEAADELREELKAKKIDVGSVRDALRFHLARQLELVQEMETSQKEENSSTPTATSSSSSLLTFSDDLLQSHPLIPTQLRAQLWSLLLGCHNKDTKLLDGFDVEKITVREAANHKKSAGDDEDDDNFSVITPQLRSNIHIDAIRTRGAMAHNEALVAELELLLVFYCHSRSVQYKQGLNEILAPIVMCMSTTSGSPPTSIIPRGQVYNAFYALISKFLPSIFNDYELENLRALFRLFRLLFLYHDSTLGNYLDHECGITPELYATSWFLTLFSSGQSCDSLETLYRLWDYYLIEDDPFLHYFIALALLRLHRQFLLTASQKDLPQILRSLQIRSGELLSLVNEAKKLRAKTPTSFRQCLFEISFVKKEMNQRIGSGAVTSVATSNVAPLISAATSGTFLTSSIISSHALEQFSNFTSLLPCLSIPATEIVQQAYSDLSGEGQIKYIVLDVRSTTEFNAGHLPCAIHISPSILHIPSQLASLISEKQYGGMRECHFCFIGSQVASFQEVSTNAPSAGSGGGHELHLPAFRRPVPPPSPASSLAALAEAAKIEEEAFHLAPSIAVKDVTHGNGEQPNGHPNLTIAVGSPLSSNSTASTSSVSGVLYRPPTPTHGLQSSPNPLASPTFLSPDSHQPHRTKSTVIQTSPLLDSALMSFVQFFLKNGFCHISICEGGFPAIHALISAQQQAYKLQKAAIANGEALSAFQTPLENMELVDHQAKLCHICNPALEPTVPQEPIPQPQPAQDPPSHSTPPASSSAVVPTSPSPVADPKKEKATSTPKKVSPTTSEGTKSDQTGSKPSTPSAEATKSGVKVDSSAPKSTDSASTSSDSKPSALSKFSLGFKKLSAGLSDKIATYKAEKAAADAIKEKERELAKIAAEKAAAEKAAADKIAAEKAATEKKEEKSTTGASAAYAAMVSTGDKSDKSRDGSEKLKSSSAHPSTDTTPKDGSLGSRFLSAFGIKKKKDKVVDQPASELNAAIDLNDWIQDDSVALFHCHEISLLPVPTTPASGTTPATPSTKRSGLLIPRVIAVTAGYVITFQPAVPPVRKIKEDGTHEASNEEPTFGLAFLKSKFRLIDLDKITSKKDKPNVLTFHWKLNTIEEQFGGSTVNVSTPSSSATNHLASPFASPFSSDLPPTPSAGFLPNTSDSPAKPKKGPTTMFLVDRPKECIALVRAKFLLAKASANLEATNKDRVIEEEEQEEPQTISAFIKDESKSTTATSTSATIAPSTSGSNSSVTTPTSSPVRPQLLDSPPLPLSPLEQKSPIDSDLMDL